MGKSCYQICDSMKDLWFVVAHKVALVVLLSSVLCSLIQGHKDFNTVDLKIVDACFHMDELVLL